MRSLFLLFTFKGTLEGWFKNGSVDREAHYYYLLSKKTGCERIYWATYGKNDCRFASQLPKEIKILPKKSFLPDFFYSFLIPLIYKKEIRRSHLIKTNQALGAWVAILTRKIYHKPLLLRTGYTLGLSVGSSGNLKEKIKKILFLWAEKIAYSSFDLATVTTKSQKEYLIKKYHISPHKILILPNFIDTNVFKPLKIKRSKQSSRVKILYVGRLNKVKNLISLLRAIKDIDNVSLDIVGDGKEKEKLVNYSQKNGIPVRFLGTIKNNQLPLIYNQYDIYSQVSFWEGNPKTVLEAMACGLPCLGTNVRGINEVIRHGYNGWLVETNPYSIRKGLLRLMKDKKLREKLGKNARKTIEEKYSLKKILEKEVSIYKKLLK